MATIQEIPNYMDMLNNLIPINNVGNCIILPYEENKIIECPRCSAPQRGFDLNKKCKYCGV